MVVGDEERARQWRKKNLTIIKYNFVDVDDYFCSGVMLMNLNYLREFNKKLRAENKGGIIQAGIAFLRSSDKVKDGGDQYILNHFFSKNYLRLPTHFDIPVDVFRARKRPIKPGIYHFLNKTLQIDATNPYNKLWFQHFYTTPWAYEMPKKIFDRYQKIFESLRQQCADLFFKKFDQRIFLSNKSNFVKLNEKYKFTEKDIFIDADDRAALNFVIKHLQNAKINEKKICIIDLNEKLYTQARDLLVSQNLVENKDFCTEAMFENVGIIKVDDFALVMKEFVAKM